MRPDDEHRRGGLEAHAPLDADNGVTHMAVAPDGVCRPYFLYLLNGLDLILVFHAVHTADLAFLEADFQQLRPVLRGMFQISTLGQALVAVQQFAAADGSPPNAHVIRILQFREIRMETVGVQEIHFFLAAQVAIARQRDNLHARRHDEKRHVETDLVVARACRTMRDGIRTHFVGIARDGDGLEDAFRRYGDGITVVAQHVAVNHVTETLLIILLRHVQRHIFLRAQLVGVFLVTLELFLAEPARVGASRINFISFFFGQIHDRV